MSAMPEARSPAATKRLARLAGALYLLWGLTTVVGFYHAPLLQSDPAVLARTLVKWSEVRFHIAVVSDVVSTAMCIPLALVFFQLFRPVNKTHASMMVMLLVLAMPISFVLALNYVAARWLLSGAPVVADMAVAQREALGMFFLGLHTHGVLAVEIFWGLWLLPFGVLVIRSRFLPRVLGVLLIVGGVAYATHSLISLLLGGQRIAPYEQVTTLARAAAEFPVILWLLIRGASLPDGPALRAD